MESGSIYFSDRNVDSPPLPGSLADRCRRQEQEEAEEERIRLLQPLSPIVTHQGSPPPPLYIYYGSDEEEIIVGDSKYKEVEGEEVEKASNQEGNEERTVEPEVVDDRQPPGPVIDPGQCSPEPQVDAAVGHVQLKSSTLDQ